VHRGADATLAAGPCSPLDRLASHREIVVTTSIRIAGIAGTLALALSAAADAAAVRLVPLSPPSVAASVTCKAVPASISNAALADLPAIAAEQNITGTTAVRIDLDAAGRLTKSSVLASSGNRWIDQAALRAARFSRYSAEVRDCAPVGGAYAYIVDFTK
jgi:TonB family protein